MTDIYEPKGNGKDFDPRVEFEVVGAWYYLDVDTDRPTLWVRPSINAIGVIRVAAFTKDYDPWEVYITALKHRTDSLKLKQRLNAGLGVSWCRQCRKMVPTDHECMNTSAR